MTILVTGATGTVGGQVVNQLVVRGADVRVLSRNPAKADLPDQVTAIQGDILDVDAMRAALDGVSTLFLLNAVVADEFTQALIALNLAREAGIERVVYLSVIHSDQYVDVPHFAGKFAVERMIEHTGIPATILRPAYYINNDVSLKDTIRDKSIYPMPVGTTGLQMVDVRDIGEVAAIELLRREDAPKPLPLRWINLVGPDLLTAASIAKIWTDTLDQTVKPVGDPQGLEQMFKQFGPSWTAYDMRKMAERFQSDGMFAESGDVDHLESLLGRPLRSYRDFAQEIAVQL